MKLFIDIKETVVAQTLMAVVKSFGMIEAESVAQADLVVCDDEHKIIDFLNANEKLFAIEYHHSSAEKASGLCDQGHYLSGRTVPGYAIADEGHPLIVIQILKKMSTGDLPGKAQAIQEVPAIETAFSASVMIDEPISGSALKMNVLVIENDPRHIHSAKESLKGHNLTVLQSADQAFEMFERNPEFSFDAVLIDMQMPNSNREGGNQRSLDKESPYGLNFIWRAAAMQSVKYIGLLSDGNHHNSPMSAAFDGFPLNQIFQLNQAKVIFCREVYHGFRGEDGEAFKGKAWDIILAYLTGDLEPAIRG